MPKSKVLTSTNWPKGLDPLKMWLTAQGVDLALRRTESAVLELVRLIGHLRFSTKERSKSVCERLFLAQAKLCRELSVQVHILRRKSSAHYGDSQLHRDKGHAACNIMISSSPSKSKEA